MWIVVGKGRAVQGWMISHFFVLSPNEQKKREKFLLIKQSSSVCLFGRTMDNQLLSRGVRAVDPFIMSIYLCRHFCALFPALFRSPLTLDNCILKQ
jgi:hypothetical protein